MITNVSVMARAFSGAAGPTVARRLHGHAPRAIGLLVLVAIAVAAASCGETSTQRNAAFAPVDRAVADLGLTRLGTVLRDVRSGSGRPLTQTPTRTVLIAMAGPLSTASSAVGAAAIGAGFEHTGAGAWRRRDGEQIVLLFVSPPEALAVPPGTVLAGGQIPVEVTVGIGT